VEYSQFKALFKSSAHVSEVWASLTKQWERSTVASKFLLCEQLYSLQKPVTESLQAFLTRCSNLYCELQTAGFLNEGMFVYKITTVLKAEPKYAVWVDILRAKDTLPKFNELAASARQFFAADIESEQRNTTIDGALSAKARLQPAIKCDYCGYNHHTKKDCRFYSRDKANDDLKPNGWYKKHHRERKAGNNQPFPSAQFAGALMMTPAALKATTQAEDGFIIDSGASLHMVKNASLLRNATPTKISVTTANAQTLLCETKGEVVIVNHNNEQVLLRDVLLQPALTCNLLSVTKADQAGVTATFTKGSVRFCERSGKLLLCGKATGSLYELQGRAVPMALVAPAITTSEVEPQPMTCTAPRNISLIWHRRLGHIGNTSLLKMAANNRAFGLPPTATISPNTLCWACASGKAVRQPFPTSGHISTKPLQLLHTDIAGPMPTASAGGAKYFVTVLDDFSKFKEVKPIAKRNDARSFIKEVILNWESQTNHKTAAIRHDRAKEYMAERLTDWCKSRGIKMQPTTGYSPQENGAAERLNRTLWETTLAMLANSGLPDKWWAEALSHACHETSRG
jgi:hypothetical protein